VTVLMVRSFDLGDQLPPRGTWRIPRDETS
jgi:hypothetical protein